MEWLPNDLGAGAIAVLLIVAFVTSMIHGATGIAGGFLLTAAAAPIIGFKLVVPVLSITLLISHSSRALLNLADVDFATYRRIALPAVPAIMLTAWIYGKLSSVVIAFMLGSVVLASIPIRRWCAARKLQPGTKLVTAAAITYGGIAGASIGPGMLLAPVMLGMGLTPTAFVATLATIALTTNLVRSSIYGFSDLLHWPYLALGIMIGLATIPGNWLGRAVLRKITNERHTRLVEWLVILGGLNFFWLGSRQLANL